MIELMNVISKISPSNSLSRLQAVRGSEVELRGLFKQKVSSRYRRLEILVSRIGTIDSIIECSSCMYRSRRISASHEVDVLHFVEAVRQ